MSEPNEPPTEPVAKPTPEKLGTAGVQREASRKRGPSGGGGRVSNGVMWLTLLFWLVSAFFGTAGLYVTREAFLTTKDGETIERCEQSAPTLVEQGNAQATDYCTYSGKLLGPELPTDAKSVSGNLVVDRDTLKRQYVETLTQPDFWLTVGLGGGAIVTLFGFARATGTLRAGLAAAISVVFLGLLLFPTFFTARVGEDLKSELMTAWQFVIMFYFGSEAAIQAWKVVHPEGAAVAGDLGGSASGPR